MLFWSALKRKDPALICLTPQELIKVKGNQVAPVSLHLSTEKRPRHPANPATQWRCRPSSSPSSSITQPCKTQQSSVSSCQAHHLNHTHRVPH